jgi:hypothetical protein
VTQKTRSIVGAGFTAALVLLTALVSFVATAHAATGAEVATESVLDQARPIFDAVMAGHYWYAAAAALVLLVALVQRYGERAPLVGKYLAWTKSSWGTPLLVILASTGGALATALAAGASPSLAMLWAALGIGAGAIGSHKLMKEVGAPMLRALQGKLPAWAQLPLSLVLWVFERPDRVAEAEAAGKTAVDAAPSTGIDGVLGKPKELP